MSCRVTILSFIHRMSVHHLSSLARSQHSPAYPHRLTLISTHHPEGVQNQKGVGQKGRGGTREREREGGRKGLLKLPGSL